MAPSRVIIEDSMRNDDMLGLDNPQNPCCSLLLGLDYHVSLDPHIHLCMRNQNRSRRT